MYYRSEVDTIVFESFESRLYYIKNFCAGVTGLTRLCQAYPRNPDTGELALNGSTDKARLTACVAHVNVLYKPFNELCLANERHARSNQHPTRNARSSAVDRTMMIDDTIVRSKQQRWHQAMT